MVNCGTGWSVRIGGNVNKWDHLVTRMRFEMMSSRFFLVFWLFLREYIVKFLLLHLGLLVSNLKAWGANVFMMRNASHYACKWNSTFSFHIERLEREMETKKPFLKRDAQREERERGTDNLQWIVVVVVYRRPAGLMTGTAGGKFYQRNSKRSPPHYTHYFLASFTTTTTILRIYNRHGIGELRRFNSPMAIP